MIRLLLALMLAAGVLSSANADPATLADAPALAAPGALTVGFRRLSLVNPDQPNLLLLDRATGRLGRADRALPLAIWYPARPRPPAGAPKACYRIATPPAGDYDKSSLPAEIGDCGAALVDQPPAGGKASPVVLLSHGLNGWATGWSRLAENLASKGYVVIAIDHGDRDAHLPGGLPLAVGLAATTRPADQRFILKALADKSPLLPAWLNAAADGANVALVAYSMGGFGAIIAAGAGVTPGGALDAAIPGDALAPWRAGVAAYESARPSNLRALVLFAPFGGGLPWRAWTADALGRISAPTLMIDGDEDDVVDFRNGVRWLFNGLKESSRALLVYEAARHNIAMDPAPSQVAHIFQYRERFDEPVWRADRIQAINAHFVTAFLDKTLKDDARNGRYLDVPTVRAVDGQWPLKDGEQVGATRAGPTQPAYWPGFQRRWAIGLELTTRRAGQ